jgi:single-strand DNA-binding protein
MNKVILIGRLTKDPEVRTTTTGKKVASFSIAVDDGKDAQGQQITQYFNVSAWDKTAEIVEKYVVKGARVAVDGSLKNRSWDKPDGTKAYATDVLVSRLEILSSKAETDAMRANAPADENPAASSSQPAAKSAPKEDIALPEINVDDINIQMPF